MPSRDNTSLEKSSDCHNLHLPFLPFAYSRNYSSTSDEVDYEDIPLFIYKYNFDYKTPQKVELFAHSIYLIVKGSVFVDGNVPVPHGPALKPRSLFSFF